MDTKIAHHDFPKDDMMSFQTINPRYIILYMKDTNTTIDFKGYYINFPLGLRFHVHDLLNII